MLRVGLLCATLSNSFASYPQGKDLKSAIEVDFDTLRFQPNVQYLGTGIGYRYMVRTWWGVQAQASVLPVNQSFHSSDNGGGIDQFGGEILLGHRWRKLALYSEAGVTDFRPQVFASALFPYYAFRNFPDFVFGGLLDIPVSRRWSLTYEVRDNFLFIGDFTEHGLPANIGFIPGYKRQVPQGKVGLAFHFNSITLPGRKKGGSR